MSKCCLSATTTSYSLSVTTTAQAYGSNVLVVTKPASQFAAPPVDVTVTCAKHS